MTTFKLIKYGVVLLILGAAIVSTNIAIKKSREVRILTSERDSIRQTIQTEAEIIAKTVDEKGFEHAIIDGSKNTYSERDFNQAQNEPRSALSPSLMDTTTAYINTLKGRNRELTAVNFQLSRKLKRMESVVDSLGNAVYSYRDKWLVLTMKVDTTGIGVLAEHTYNGEVVIAEEERRAWWPWGKLTRYKDIFFNDPYATINGVKHIRIDHSPSRFRINVEARGGYNWESGEPTAGMGLRTDLGRFSIDAERMYNPRQENWNTNIRGGFSLFKIE